MLDLGRQYSGLREEILLALSEVLDSHSLILGPAVDRFEAAAAVACGVPYAIGCASGTDALWLALAAARIGPGDAVITTPFSFFATVSSILRAGATPLLADIDPATFNLCPAATRTALVEARRHAPHLRVRAVLPVHLYGQCADMDAFRELCAEEALLLIEDAAQAFGARWQGSPAGALGDAAAFSFYPTKNLSAAGDAGLVTTSSAELADRVRMLRSHGMRQRYEHEEVGWNSRLDSLQAAILEIKLRHLAQWNHQRRTLACRYSELFQTAGLVAPATSTTPADGLVLPIVDPRGTPVFHQYVIRTVQRDEVRQHLAHSGIASEVYYPIPLHRQQAFSGMDFGSCPLPESDRAAAEVLALPLFPELREEEQDRVVASIADFFGG